MQHPLKNIFIITIALTTVLFFACQKKDTGNLETIKHTPLFKLLSPQQTGVYFQNELTEGLNTNILMYEYFYNGGGVAVGDLNGDSLVDIYFTSNMSENKLYLNKGKMQFQDVTDATGTIGRPGPWKTGVAMADINGDNKLDIYICYSGALPDSKRTNQLYINQGNNSEGIPIFEEQAKEYGLASNAYSNQTYYFDYDLDGDLDVLLLNHNPKSLPILNAFENAQLIQTNDPLIGVRLFRQNGERFEDVTLQSAISSSELTYGLGLGISDFNNDGWPDFYICNDYSVPDYLYINNQNGTFTNKISESLNHTTLSSMGNDVADINNDSWPDILALDMLPEGNRRQKLLLPSDSYEKFDLNVQSGFHRQYMRNMLQLNNGNGTFSEIGQLAGISNTDWSWSALLADYDNDGWKDVLISNGYYKDFTNMDFLKFMNTYVSKKGRLIREDIMEIIKHLPTEDIINYMYLNNQGITFSNVTDRWGLNQPSKSNGSAYADLDNDGDLDLIMNNINQSAFIYENQADKNPGNNYIRIKLVGEGKNTQGIGSKITIYADGQRQSVEQFTSRGYLSSVSSIIHFGLGRVSNIDSLVLRWPKGNLQKIENLSSNQLLTLYEKEATLKFYPKQIRKPIFTETSPPVNYKNPEIRKRDFERQPLLFSELSYEGPCLIKGDVNQDGLEDIFVGGARGQAAALFVQQGNNKFIRKPIAAFEEDRESENVDAVIFDANGDGEIDIYVASGGYHSFQPNDELLQDRLYLDNGKGDFVKCKDCLPQMLVSKGCVTFGDFNGDGNRDLFVGGRLIPGRYPETPQSFLLINDGTGHFSDQTKDIAPDLQNFGMITDAAVEDINRDGLQDLVVVGEWSPVSIFINQSGKLVNKTADYFDREYIGWWNEVMISDFNGDQKPDFLIGNLGTNTQFRASESEPVEVYFKDFDNNGSVDPIFCYYINNKSCPYLTRDELLGQMPSLQSIFPTYESFTEAGIKDIFQKGELDNAGHLVANHLETSLFLSSPNGKYELAPLPLPAQFAPVYSVTIADFNKDGSDDIVLSGNNSHLKLRLGAIDANYGVLLKGDGKGKFQYIDQKDSGLKLRGDVRSSIKINDNFFFGVNQGSIVTYTLND